MMEIQLHNDGCLRLEPHVWLREKGGLRDFRRLLALSAGSDREHGTQTLTAWGEAVRDNYQEDKEIELRELQNAELEHKGRLRAAVYLRDEHLRREEERFRKAKVHRGKSHAERVQEIEEKYSRMIAEENRGHPRRLDAISKRAARRRKQAEAWMAEVRRYRDEDRTQTKA